MASDSSLQQSPQWAWHMNSSLTSFPSAFSSALAQPRDARETDSFDARVGSMRRAEGEFFSVDRPHHAMPSKESPQIGTSVEHLMAHVNDLQLEYQQQQAAGRQLRIRRVASLGPLLWRHMRANEERLLLSVLGIWKYAVVLAVTSKAISLYNADDSASKFARKAGDSNAVTRVGTVVGDLWLRRGLVQLVGRCVSVWHMLAAATVRARRISERTLAFVLQDQTFKKSALASVFSAWRVSTVEARSAQHRVATRRRRAPLRAELCEAQCETAKLRGSVTVVEARNTVLRSHVTRVLDMLNMSLNACEARRLLGDGRPPAAHDSVVDDTQLVNEIETIQRLRSQTLVKLRKARSILAGVARTKAPCEAQGAKVEQHTMDFVRTMLKEIQHSRLECQRLRQQINSERGAATVGQDQGQQQAEMELQRERCNTASLEERLADARTMVSQLIAQNRQITEEELPANASRHPGAHAMNSEIPTVEKALCDLAEVSEKLLTTA